MTKINAIRMDTIACSGYREVKGLGKMQTKEEGVIWEHLGSDAPKKDPAEDAFGYREFAKRLAKTVVKMPSPNGFIIGLDGAWGTGKSSILNFVQYYLKEEVGYEQPMVIEFNPWWFSNSDQLAKQLLSRFAEKISHESPSLLKLGELISQYAGELGTIVGSAAGAPPRLIEALFSKLKKQEKGIPELKDEIAQSLKKTTQRFLFIIDDVDRLSPIEVAELIKVVKALADFPQVIYILAYDRGIIAEAVGNSLNTDGEAFLEKIIQVEFPVPMVANRYIHRELFNALDILLNSSSNPVFDASYWRHVFYGNLDSYIRKPRDVVRVMNSLRGTYPMVAGEVNSVDFIAITFIRIFEPGLYKVLQNNIAMFAKEGVSEFEKREFQDFHHSWLDGISQVKQKSIKRLIGVMFPVVSQVWDTHFGGGINRKEARRELRICSPETVHIYFELRVTDLEASQEGLRKLIALSENRAQLIDRFLSAKNHKLEDGSSLANFYVERLKDKIDEVNEIGISNLLHLIADHGDTLLSESDQNENSLVTIPNSWKIQWLFQELLGRLNPDARLIILTELLEHGNAFGTLVFIVHDLIRSPETASSAREEAFRGLPDNAPLEFKRILTDRLEKLTLKELLSLSYFPFVLTRWLEWTDGQDLRLKVQTIVNDQELLPVFLEKWVSKSRRSTSKSSWVVHSLNPNVLKDLINPDQLEQLVIEILNCASLTDTQKEAGTKYLKGMDAIRDGKDPDRDWDDDLGS